MNKWLKIVVPILLGAVLVYATVLFLAWHSDRTARLIAEKAIAAALKELNNPQADQEARLAAEKSRKELQEHGFKLTISEFDFTTSPEIRARAAAITNVSFLYSRDWADFYVPLPRQTNFVWARPLGSNTALVTWKQAKLGTGPSINLWNDLREMIMPENSVLNTACQAALSGPIGFEPVLTGTTWILSYLSNLRMLGQILAARTVLELHDGNRDQAWTNLLAVTRLITAWNPEPLGICLDTRFREMRNVVEPAVWEALQYTNWTEEQLVSLQREWESADFFARLPDTVNPELAGMLSICEFKQQQLSNDLAGSLGQLQELTSELPEHGWENRAQRTMEKITGQLYLARGFFQDKDALIRYFLNRESQIKQAISKNSWAEMCATPGVTNVVFFQTKAKSSQMAYLMFNWRYSVDSNGKTVLWGRASEAEARRRLIVTAIALERFRLQNGKYPQTLDELVPRFLKVPPIDFMDGQPLRYRRTNDGHFILYSVGLDCHDDGGIMRMPNQSPLSPRNNFDLVWPLPVNP
jgi:hypothetical protein